MTAPTRIASLLPSATEIVWALGAGDRLVARSHECDFPPTVAVLPACTSSKLHMDGTAYEIDDRVKALLQEGLSIYRVDAQRLQRARADVILTQDHCRACAVSVTDLQAAIRDVLDPEPELVILSPASLEDVLADIRRIGRAVGRGEAANRLVREMEDELAQIRRKASEAGSTPTVGMIEWLDPPMVAGNWMPTLVEIAGGRPVLATAGQHSPWLNWNRFLKSDPDLIVVTPCGYGLERTARELGVLTARTGWNELAAVQRQRVYLADGNHYFNRPGPRVVDSARILAEIMHPDRFPPDHRGASWVRA